MVKYIAIYRSKVQQLQKKGYGIKKLFLVENNIFTKIE